MRRILLPAALVALLSVSALQDQRLKAARGIVPDTATTAMRADVPPMVSFATVALGGFRGVIADLLWLRVCDMQEENRFIELMQLSEWITTLEPGNGEVWAYHAWNLAYNVSIMHTRAEDRWRWVNAGISLLRDRGIPLNPSDARIRRELAWILLHKVGGDSDAAAPFYRQTLRAQIAPLLTADGRPPADGDAARCDGLRALGLLPARMREIDARFGAVDWRLSAAQALYWALEGLDRAGQRERLQCRRIAYQALLSMLRGGYGMGSAADSRDPLHAPNPRLLEGTIAFLEETLREHPFRGVRAAITGAYIDGVHLSLRAGDVAKARDYYDRIRAVCNENATPPPFDDFVQGRASVDWPSLLP